MSILRVANSRMAGAIRLVSIERGFDPKRFAFMPFGGGGALHTGAMLADGKEARCGSGEGRRGDSFLNARGSGPIVT